MDPRCDGPGRKFIVITGCNGVGKTSVAQVLCERLDARLFHYPPEFIDFRSRASLDTAVAPLARLLYYLGASVHLSDLVGQQLAQSHVICDRYHESPASLLVAESALEEDDMDGLCAPFLDHLRVPDTTLLLTASYQTACARIRARLPARATRAERLVLDSEEFFLRRQDALRSQAARLGPVRELDTTDLSVAAMGEAAWALVGLGR